MTTKEFENLCNKIFREIQKRTPNPETRYVPWYINAYGNRQRGSTGNLAFNALRMEWRGKDECHIYIDEDIAPYMPDTNEPWISPKWRGHKNPNEGWWERGAELINQTILNEIGTDLIQSSKR